MSSANSLFSFGKTGWVSPWAKIAPVAPPALKDPLWPYSSQPTARPLIFHHPLFVSNSPVLLATSLPNLSSGFLVPIIARDFSSSLFFGKYPL